MSSIRREFVKMLFQKRTYIGWAGLFIIPFLIMLAFRFSNGGPGGGGGGGAPDVGELIFSQIRDNGLYLIVAALWPWPPSSCPCSPPCPAATPSPARPRTARCAPCSCSPPGAGTFLMSKWFVANLYVAICLLVLGVAALIAGGSVFGLNPVTLFTGQQVGVWHALGLAVASYAFVFVGMMCVVSLAVLFSTLTNSSLTAVAERPGAGDHHGGLAGLLGLRLPAALPVHQQVHANGPTSSARRSSGRRSSRRSSTSRCGS